MRPFNNYWIFSDTHFNHRKLVTNGHRPDNFETLLYKSLLIPNECDIFVHLGDVCMGDDVFVHNKIIDVCRARTKILVRGNHDKKTISWYYEKGWTIVVDSFSLNIYGKRILFTHIPIQHENLEIYDFNIHGHLHDVTPAPTRNLSEKHILIKMEHTYTAFQLKKLVGM